MRYEVRVSENGSFQIELSPIRKRVGVAYMVLKVLPGEGEFDGIIEAELITGPTQIAP